MSSDTSCQDRQKKGPHLKTVMGTLLFRNVFTLECRQIPDRPSLLSLHDRAGLYLLENMVDTYAFKTRASYAVPQGGRVYLNLCVSIRLFGFPDGSNIWSTVPYTEIGFDLKN